MCSQKKKKSQNSQEEVGEEVKKPLTQIVNSRKGNCAKMGELRKLKGKLHKVNKLQKIWEHLKYLIRNSG